MSNIDLRQGDCLELMKSIPDNSVDSIVTDPPYELGFMGKSWDNTGIANDKNMWAECLRVLKPGGHLLAFSGTRTYHRMASAIEDAGFEVRDMIEWVYGCLSEDTEILTANGWKMLYSVFEGDYVFACDYINDMKLQLEPVKQKFIYDYDEDAYHIKDTGYYNSELMETDHIVSKNHNVLVSESWAMDCFSNGEYPQKVAAEVLYKNVQKRKELGYKSDFHIPGLNGFIPCTIEKIHYKGKVWCVEVESGAFVARRNGKIFITGNSGFPKSLNIGKKIDHLIGNEALKEKEIEFVRWFKKHCHLSSEEIDKIFGWKNRAFHFFAESDSNRHIPNLEQYKILKKELSLSDEYDDFVKKHSLLLEEIRDIQGYEKSIKNWDKKYDKAILNKPKTELASEWEGWGTALKPAHEPICMARKPLSEKNVALNCLKWGTGGINIDESRVEYQSEADKESATPQGKCTSNTSAGSAPDVDMSEVNYHGEKYWYKNEYKWLIDKWLNNEDYVWSELKENLETYDWCKVPDIDDGDRVLFDSAEGVCIRLYESKRKEFERPEQLGRFPANLIHDNSEEVRECFPEQKSGKRSSTYEIGNDEGEMFNHGIYGKYKAKNYDDVPASSGNASRFFKSIIYQAKASKSERNRGLDGFEEKIRNDGRAEHLASGNMPHNRSNNAKKNHHPTVKPLKLMSYLITLTTREGDTVLDPFMGSGTTGVACVNTNRNFIGIELDEKYFEIAEKRIKREEV